MSLAARSLRIAGALLGSAFVASAAHALDPDRAISQFPHAWYEEQLPQNTVLSITQRGDGSIWLATYAGLVRYSGGAFEAIDRKNAPALESTAITALLTDSTDTLWIGTLNGGLYRARGRRIEPYSLPAGLSTIFLLAEDRDGRIWMATEDGVARADATGVTLLDMRGLARGPYRAIAADRAGDVWISVEGVGIERWGDDGVDVFDLDDGLPSTSVWSLAIDRDGVLWAATQEGIARWNGARFERDPAAAALDAERVNSLHGDRDGGLWITVQGKGVCRLLRAKLECQETMRGMSNDIVRSMLEDREGNLWIGTTHSGLHRISDSKLVTVTGAIASNSVRTVFEDKSGTIWVGTDGGGVARVEHRRLVPAWPEPKLPSDFVRTIHGDAAGNLWIGTIEGVTRVDPQGRARDFTVADGLPAAIVFAIEDRADGGLWLGTTLGLAIVEGDAIRAVPAVDGDIRSLHEDSGGRLWIGRRSGLRCLRGDVVDTCGTDGLANLSVFAFHPRGEDELWLGTSQGVMRWRGGGVDRFGEKLGMAGDAVFAILEDQASDFWVSTNRGIAQVTQRQIAMLDSDSGTGATVAPQWFGKSDGMLSSQGNGASQSPARRTRDGRLWFGTANGLVEVDPAHIRRNALAPSVAIERVRVDEVDADPGTPTTFGPGVERIEFHFAGMSYVAPEAVRYRYRLEGFDRDWIDAGGRRAAYYTNVPPGQYVFRATASNNDGVWSPTGAEFAFDIRPQWYETPWFRALVVLAFAGAVLAAFRLRVWQVRARERELTFEVAQRTEALRAANAQLQQLAKRDGLTGIANRGAFDEALQRAWESHRERHAPLALLLCDVDSFKAYNDTYGHQAGDEALIRVAACLANAVRTPDDIAARYGGEEMALLLSDCDEATAQDVAEHLLRAVRALAIPHRQSPAASHVTISIGCVAAVPTESIPPQSLVRRADEALYLAKRLGRDRVEVQSVAPYPA